MKISDDIKLDFGDVLIKPKRSTIVSRKDVDYIRSFDTLHSHRRISGFPLIVGNMDTTGTISMWKAMKPRSVFVALHKYQTIEQMKEVGNDDNNAFITIGEKREELELLVKNNINPLMILLDAANAYRESFVDSLKRVREAFPTSVLMAGNVCTPEMTEQLVLSGADIVKCGIGPGLLCKTRTKTGVGYPQLSAILECKDAAHGLGGLICADGGIRNAGDVAKAFGAGADFCMVCSMFMGCDECEGEWVYHKPIELQERIKTKLKCYGMSSHEAQKKYLGEIQKHRASEGDCKYFDYKGKSEDVLDDIIGGVVSACSYVGARRLKDFDKCCTFVRVNRIHT